MAERRLISTRRAVPGDALERYEQTWVEVVALAKRADVRAWRFRAERDGLRFIEFLEYGGGDNPLQRSEIASALGRLDAIGVGDVEQWRDASPPDPDN